MSSKPPGALVLLCSSKKAGNFQSVKGPMIKKLESEYADRIQFSFVSSINDLVSNLTSPATLFDIEEIHILIAFDNDAFRIGSGSKGIIQSGSFSSLATKPVLSISGGLILKSAKVTIWYLSPSSSVRPQMSDLSEWTDFFNLRLLFLPFDQLRKELRSIVKKPKANSKTSNIKPKEKVVRKVDRPGGFALSTPQILIILGLAGAINHIFSDSPSLMLAGKFDQVISHEDTSEDIAYATRNIDSTRGDSIEFSWVHNRTRWDFTFFIAREWLYESEKELKEVAKNPGRWNQYWASIYRDLLVANDERLDNVVRALEKHSDLLGMDDYETANFVLSFVQHIRYKIPNNYLELLAPPQTLDEEFGDCDSKSLLYVLLMEKMGFDTVIYVSKRYRHAMAGVKVSGSGSFKKFDGNRYYFAETTAVGHRIGQLASNWGGLNYWKLINI
jgi:hypothetical protein